MDGPLKTFTTLGVLRHIVFQWKRIRKGYTWIVTIDEEESLNAENNHQFFKFELEIFNKSFKNVSAVTGDNSSANLTIGKMTNVEYGCLFFGCASYRFKFVLQDLLEPHKAVLDRLHKLCKTLKKNVLADKLRIFTHRKAKTAILTRWSSSSDIIDRFFRIEEEKSQGDEIFDMIPSIRKRKQIEMRFNILKDLQYVLKRFQ